MSVDSSTINNIFIKYRFPIPRLNHRLDEFGLYEWLAMPFSISYTLSTFLHLVNEVLRPFIRKFMVMYFDDIFICSQNEVSHMQHLTQVFQV